GGSTEPRVSNAERPTGNRPLLDDASLAGGRGALDTWLLTPALVAGVIAYILPVGIWICAIFVFGGRAYAYDILFHQNVTRYVAAWNNVAPWYYYFYRIPLGLFPWTLLLPAALLASRGLPAGQARLIRGLLIACGTLFVFFTISTGRRGVYVLPLYFALALLIAAAWRRTDSRPLRILASAHV